MSTRESPFLLRTAAVCLGILAAVAATGTAATEPTCSAGVSIQPVLQQPVQKSVAEACKQGLTASPAALKATSLKTGNGDINANGILDFDDVVKINDAVKDFVKYDLNKDGAINKADVGIAYDGMENVSDISIDINGNGLKDFDDVVKVNDAILAMEQYDYNRDGKLNSDDVNAAYDAVGIARSNGAVQAKSQQAGTDTSQRTSPIKTTYIPQAMIRGTRPAAAVTSQSTVRGDANGNGTLDVDDIVKMKDAIKELRRYDLNNDDTINMKDVKIAFRAIEQKGSKVKMDFNGNGIKDFDDVIKVYSAISVMTKCDFNGDGKVDRKDVKAVHKLL